MPEPPSVQTCFIWEACLEYEASSVARFQVILPSQSLGLVVYLFATEHHKYFYRLANF